MSGFCILDDSGARITYGEGMAMREPSVGKGRYDLVSPFAMRRLAKHYENGARKYTRDIEVTRGDLLSVIKKELETNTNAYDVVLINYTAKECVEAVMKNRSENEIWNMFFGREKMQENGTKNTPSGLRMQQGEDEKTKGAESEIEKTNVEQLSEKSDSKKIHINYYSGNKMKSVRFAAETLTMLKKHILTMTIRLGGREEYYVVDATTESECFANLLKLCRTLFPTLKILQLKTLSEKDSYVMTLSGSRNWEKGIPFSRYIDSAKRHLDKYIMGMTDEDHLAAAAWNIFAIMHHQELGQTELDDMPHYDCKYEHE